MGVGGHLDDEGSCIDAPGKRQAPAGERGTPCTVVLWRDV